MKTIEIARKLAEYDQRKDACKAYTLALTESGLEPAAELEAAAYILQFGGNYKVSYTCFQRLYNRGFFKEEILPLMYKVFYEPNIKMLQGRYERNVKLLKKYPYLFRKDFLDFEALPIQFYPYDDHNGYVPFYQKEDRFGSFINFRNPVISRNFFKDLKKPVFASNVFSQYELEYLHDNVRKSEYIGRENHVYLHYSDWSVFCSYLCCLNLRPLLEGEKIVFLIGEEESQYPIDFKERFGIDYSRYAVKPVGIREINRMIWHTQLSTHNGGDFFNEIFDAHPNLLCLPSIMMYNVEELAAKIRNLMTESLSLAQAQATFKNWNNPRLVEELYHMKDRTDKDMIVAYFLQEKMASAFLDPVSRIAPALFFQPHFHNIVYSVKIHANGGAVLESKHNETIHASPLFRQFKYIKAFTPMRRFTTSHGATVKFMYQSTQKNEAEAGGVEKEKTKSVVADAVMQRVLNRSFMVDPDDRLYKDSVVVRFEDGKLNPTATFTALAAFLDLPYTKSMTYCSESGKTDYGGAEDGIYAYYGKRIAGFDTATVYRTYDEYTNENECYYIEYFLRDAYAYYGYDFHYYDGTVVDEEKVKELVAGFDRINHYIRLTWKKIFHMVNLTSKDTDDTVPEEVTEAVRGELLEQHIAGYTQNRIENARVLMNGLHFVSPSGQPLRMVPLLQLDSALLEQPLYH